MDSQQRYNTVLKNQLCFGCLSAGHSLKSCRSSRKCGIEGCSKSHHRMLHQRRPAHQEQKEKPQGTNENEGCSVHVHEAGQRYYQVIPVTLTNGTKRVETYAFLDSGSSLTLLNEETANALELEARLLIFTHTSTQFA